MQIGTAWDNVTHSRNGRKSGGKEKIYSTGMYILGQCDTIQKWDKEWGKGKI